MLTGLGLDRLVRGNHKYNKINARHTCEHVFDEPFMARNVYKCDAEISRQLQVRESEIN